MGAVGKLPRPVSRYSRAALVASSAVLLGLSVGCAESGQPPVAPPPSAPSAPKEAPTGQSRPGRFEGRNMSFDYPPRWRVAEETSVPGVEIQIENPRGRAGVEPTVSALSDRGFRESFEALVNLFELGPISAVPNRKVLARRPVRVEGAQEALLIDQRGTQYVRDGRAVAPEEVRDGDEPVTLRQWTVLALGPGGVNVNVAMAAPAEEFRASRPEFQRIVGSLRLRP